MIRKLSPTVDVFGIILSTSTEGSVKVVVNANIGDYDIDGEVLEGYVDAVCILSADTSLNVSDLFFSQYHWTDPLWYDTYTGNSVLLGKRIKSSATDIQFEFDIDGTSIIEDLSFFTYIQVDTQSMATDYSIDIPKAYKNMSGNFNTGAILVNGDIDGARNRYITDARDEVTGLPT
tara:strand:- start:4426 stop:4953 length:528 start_codon:yes stop_codon:yes gene_type:complete